MITRRIQTNQNGENSKKKKKYRGTLRVNREDRAKEVSLLRGPTAEKKLKYSSSSSIVKTVKLQRFKSDLNTMTYPYLHQILDHLKTIDQAYFNDHSFPDDSLEFCIRMKIFWKINRFQNTFNLTNETFFIAVHIMDKVLMSDYHEYVAYLVDCAGSLKDFVMDDSEIIRLQRSLRRP